MTTTNNANKKQLQRSYAIKDASPPPPPPNREKKINIKEFLVETVNRSNKDFNFLVKLEEEIIQFVNGKGGEEESHPFPPMTSYQRMLLHRLSTYYNLDHNIDATGQCIIITMNESTTTLVQSVKEMKTKKNPLPDKLWTHSAGPAVTKVKSLDIGSSCLRDSLVKAHSFEGTRGVKATATPYLQTSMNNVSLSPASSGYKSRQNSTISPSQTPPPSFNLPEGKVLWVLSDKRDVPNGAIIIDPVTLSPYLNADGSVYHHTRLEDKNESPQIINPIRYAPNYYLVPSEEYYHLQYMPTTPMQNVGYRFQSQVPFQSQMNGQQQVVMSPPNYPQYYPQTVYPQQQQFSSDYSSGQQDYRKQQTRFRNCWR